MTLFHVLAKLSRIKFISSFIMFSVLDGVPVLAGPGVTTITLARAEAGKWSEVRLNSDSAIRIVDIIFLRGRTPVGAWEFHLFPHLPSP